MQILSKLREKEKLPKNSVKNWMMTFQRRYTEKRPSSGSVLCYSLAFLTLLIHLHYCPFQKIILLQLNDTIILLF